ncbi:GNAT family N-acetyltransferase [Pseudoduganella buxea]|uniref:N-acetyltransferase n=1 Tax=Pseudoduganella buxea TaxID=1949069 RepID=A0A6I3SZ52_9BURK|nr:GNAT family N-acetyltransferase [Pseudoduganella buxea]MTV53905.1 GNAT family N-acetyltransferase [Pseudoduganella buxea]GGC03369.1 N-acetyltransferase [Pseudoduganella buxea]
MTTTLAIRPATPADLPAFFDYLVDQLRDNGAGDTPLFQPMSRTQAGMPPGRMDAFTRGTQTPLFEPGWRRLWLAFDGGAIRGHIDLRAHAEGASGHRALLGMGVHRGARRIGLGMALLDTAIAWAEGQAALDWIDLEVLAVNAPARALYRKRGFVQTGEIEDLLRIDGERHGYVYMSLSLGRQAAGAQPD